MRVDISSMPDQLVEASYAGALDLVEVAAVLVMHDAGYYLTDLEKSIAWATLLENLRIDYQDYTDAHRGQEEKYHCDERGEISIGEGREDDGVARVGDWVGIRSLSTTGAQFNGMLGGSHRRKAR